MQQFDYSEAQSLYYLLSYLVILLPIIYMVLTRNK